jgi:catechol-2,3-dioxygenase
MTGPFLQALRSVEIALPELEAAEKFFTETWRLKVVDRYQGSIYLLGSGPVHHLLALHHHATPVLRSVTLRKHWRVSRASRS